MFFAILVGYIIVKKKVSIFAVYTPIARINNLLYHNIIAVQCQIIASYALSDMPQRFKVMDVAKAQ